MVDYQTLLTKEIFKNIDEQVIKDIINNFEMGKHLKNKPIFYEGDHLETIYIIITGKVEISKYDINGNKNIVTLLGAYDMFAESIALSETKLSPYTVTALENTQTLEINVDDFMILAHEHQQLLTNIIDILANKNTYLTFKIDCLSQRNIRNRVYEILHHYALINQTLKVKLPFNRSQLAEFLCVNRSALTRELSVMEQDNIFSYQDGYYFLNDKIFN